MVSHSDWYFYYTIVHGKVKLHGLGLVVTMARGCAPLLAPLAARSRGVLC